MAQVKLNTPSDMPQTKIVEQTSSKLVTREEWSNGLILVLTVDVDGTTVDGNYNWLLQPDGSRTPNYDSPNTSFIDPLN